MPIDSFKQLQEILSTTGNWIERDINSYVLLSPHCYTEIKLVFDVIEDLGGTNHLYIHTDKAYSMGYYDIGFLNNEFEVYIHVEFISEYLKPYLLGDKT